MATKRVTTKGRNSVFSEKFHSKDKFLKRVEELKKEGINPTTWEMPSSKGHSKSEWGLCYNRINR